MKIGIYVAGLGQSFNKESVEKYAERLMNEIDFRNTGTTYEIKTEKVSYFKDRESTVVSICEKEGDGKTIYKLYEFQYRKLLTERFNKMPILFKNFWLFLMVIRKFPLIIFRLFKRNHYNRPFQTLYVFSMFLIIAFSVLLMLPATFEVIGGDAINAALTSMGVSWTIPELPATLSKITVGVTAVLLLILPNANMLLADLATEFVCANDYLEYGVQRPLIQGNLELLVNYISENEEDCKIHFHAYSFGSIVAIDYIFPYGREASLNAKTYCEALITIGTPFEFIKAYYRKFYLNRNTSMEKHITWINIYSVADALATNFRKDGKAGDAEFGISDSSLIPINHNYEVIAPSKGVMAFFFLNSLRAHGMYWDPQTEGLSCLGLVLDELKKKSLIDTGDDNMLNVAV
jgi:hypothetical protein